MAQKYEKSNDKLFLELSIWHGNKQNMVTVMNYLMNTESNSHLEGKLITIFYYLNYIIYSLCRLIGISSNNWNCTLIEYVAFSPYERNWGGESLSDQ